MHSFTFNGRSSEEFGIRIERFPDLNRSARKFQAASVSGRNGNIYQMENAWEEVTVSYQIFAGERQEGAAVPDFTAIMEWLNSADDYAVLTDTYDPKHYRLAVFVDEIEIVSQWHTFGKATVMFRCRPQRFLAQNGTLLKSEAIEFNNFTSVYNGITVSSYDGTVTMSGTVTNNGSIGNYFAVTQATQITITQEMVDNNGYFYLDNTSVFPVTMTVVSENSIVIFIEENMPAYYKRQLTQADVGKKFLRFMFTSTRGTVMDVTFSPKVVYEEASSFPAEIQDGDQIYNPTNHIALPIITLKSGIVRSMLNLNSYAMSTSGLVSIPQDLLSGNQYFQGVVGLYKQGYCCWFRDTPGSMAYSGSSGTSGTLTTIDNAIGTVTFTPESTSWGLALIIPVVPESHYRLTCDVSSNDTSVDFYQIEGSGRNRWAGIAWSNASSGTINNLVYTYPETGYLMILFKRTSGSGSVSFSSIMMEQGRDTHVFSPYAADTPESVSINGIQLQFTSNGYDQAVIDCERENFTINGVNANNITKVLDRYGNESVDFLRLDKGTNKIEINSAILSATIDPRYWEL